MKSSCFLAFCFMTLLSSVYSQQVASKLCRWQNPDQKWSPYTGIRIFEEYEIEVPSGSDMHAAMYNLGHAIQKQSGVTISGGGVIPEPILTTNSLIKNQGYLIISCTYGELTGSVQNVTSLLGKHCLDLINKPKAAKLTEVAPLCVSISAPSQRHTPWQLEIVNTPFASNYLASSSQQLPLLASKIGSRSPMIELNIRRFFKQRLKHFKSTSSQQHGVLLHVPLLSTPGVLNRKLPHAAP